jgi:hypothetical protein
MLAAPYRTFGEISSLFAAEAGDFSRNGMTTRYDAASA